MANIFLGVGVNFGVSSTGMSGSGIGTFKLQSNDHTKKAKTDDVMDGDGETVQRTVYDPSEEATFEYVISATTTAGAVTATTQAAVGTLVTVTDANDASIAATNWIVTDSTKKRSNTKAALVTLKLERFAGITAVTS